MPSSLVFTMSSCFSRYYVYGGGGGGSGESLVVRDHVDFVTAPEGNVIDILMKPPPPPP